MGTHGSGRVEEQPRTQRLSLSHRRSVPFSCFVIVYASTVGPLLAAFTGGEVLAQPVIVGVLPSQWAPRTEAASTATSRQEATAAATPTRSQPTAPEGSEGGTGGSAHEEGRQRWR